MNQLEIRVVGMSRSGNHAILNWILAQAEGRRCFLNCVEPKENPFRSARPMRDGSCWRADPPFRLARERRGDLSRKDLLLYSYEDAFLGMVAHERFEREHDRWVGASRRRVDLLILRDPFNLFASRLRSGFGEVGTHTAGRIWRQHARELLGARNHLRHRKVAITYNEWATSRPAREELAARLDLSFTDAGVDRVPRTGGGSSFDGTRYDGRAGDMRVHERWRDYEEDAGFWRIFDDATLALARRIFRRGSRGERLYPLLYPDGNPGSTAARVRCA